MRTCLLLLLSSVPLSLALAERVRLKPIGGENHDARRVEPAPAPSAAPSSRSPVSRGHVSPQRSYERHRSPSNHRTRPASHFVSAPSSQTKGGAGRTRIIRRSDGDPAPDRHDGIVGDRTIIRSIERDRRVEIAPNRHYWHNSGGQRYVHTYRGGHHWYGFYSGPRFYWTRYHRDRWWWYDPGFAHWTFWANGYWWWNGPGNVLYVYQNDSYYPYNEAPIAVAIPSAGPAPSSVTEAAATGGVWTSPDGKRMVQIHGMESEAFLYDKSGAEPRYLAYLGKNVSQVRFGEGERRLLQILVDFKTGEFAMYSADGRPFDAQPVTEVPESANIPPPPTDVPN